MREDTSLMKEDVFLFAYRKQCIFNLKSMCINHLLFTVMVPNTQRAAKIQGYWLKLRSYNVLKKNQPTNQTNDNENNTVGVQGKHREKNKLLFLYYLET